MADQQIRDRNNRLVATIRTLSSGKQEIRDPNTRLLGTFDLRSNETRDSNNRLVAKGNALASLVPPS
jgi:hypothetical protein